MHEIGHVSDTALMVAAARALETTRPGGLVSDPFAGRLAGERGMAILQGTSRLEMLSFGVGMRCRFIEELLMGLVREDRIGRVLSLGAGLDTRPWRLDLPAALEWVEVDFEDMLSYKENLLAGEVPHCRRERIAADLADPESRTRIFEGADERTLVITEGLLMYLAGEVVEALTRHGSGAGYWLVELVSHDFGRRVGMNNCQSIAAVRAPGAVEGEMQKSMFEAAGWKERVRKSYMTDIMAAAPERVRELQQARAAAGMQPAGPPPDPTDISGVYLWER